MKNKSELTEAKSASMNMMRKAVSGVNDTLMRLNKRPNGDYENLLTALKSGNSKKFIPMLVPYVEDVIDGIEAKDNSGIFTDSDIVDVADEVADRHMRALGLLDESVSDVVEGVGAYTLKKTKVEKNEDEDNGTQTITHYDIMLGGKKVGKLSRDDYFGQVDGELHGKPIPQTAIGSDVQAWLHKFLKSKKGAKFAMQAEAKDCGCNDAQEEQEFMFAMKKKDKLKESIISKVKFLHKD